MFSFQSVHAAYMQCRRHKRNTLNALAFEHNLIENLWDLTHDLQAKRYRIGSSLVFLTHSPKLREVFAADFRDRVVHHVLVNMLEPIFERRFIHDVYNNRRGKGTHAAIRRAQTFMRQTRGGYYLQLDIKGFFYHLNKQILMEKIKEGVLKALSSVTDDNANKFASPKTTNQTTSTQGAAISIAESHATQVATPNEAMLSPLPPIGAATLVAENDANQFASPNTTNQSPPPEVILAEIKHFLSVRASFAGHIQHASSYNLSQKTGALDETNPFEYDRA